MWFELVHHGTVLRGGNLFCLSITNDAVSLGHGSDLAAMIVWQSVCVNAWAYAYMCACLYFCIRMYVSFVPTSFTPISFVRIFFVPMSVVPISYVSMYVGAKEKGTNLYRDKGCRDKGYRKTLETFCRGPGNRNILSLYKFVPLSFVPISVCPHLLCLYLSLSLYPLPLSQFVPISFVTISVCPYIICPYLGLSLYPLSLDPLSLRTYIRRG